jgi:hypothetical protein
VGRGVGVACTAGSIGTVIARSSGCADWAGRPRPAASTAAGGVTAGDRSGSAAEGAGAALGGAIGGGARRAASSSTRAASFRRSSTGSAAHFSDRPSPSAPGQVVDLQVGLGQAQVGVIAGLDVRPVGDHVPPGPRSLAGGVFEERHRAHGLALRQGVDAVR